MISDVRIKIDYLQSQEMEYKKVKKNQGDRQTWEKEKERLAAELLDARQEAERLAGKTLFDHAYLCTMLTMWHGYRSGHEGGFVENAGAAETVRSEYLATLDVFADELTRQGYRGCKTSRRSRKTSSGARTRLGSRTGGVQCGCSAARSRTRSA